MGKFFSFSYQLQQSILYKTHIHLVDGTIDNKILFISCYNFVLFSLTDT